MRRVWRTFVLLFSGLLLAACVSSDAPGEAGGTGGSAFGREAGRAGGTVMPPYPRSPVISGITFRWNTHKQLAPGSDIWPVTWSADDHQYTAWGDGGGFGGSNRIGRVSLGIGRVEGTASSYRGYNVWGGVNPEAPAAFTGKSTGILALGTDLYLWRCGAGSGDRTFEFQALYKSTDNGRHWQAANWEFRGLNFHCITFLQSGKGNKGARDDYVYMYVSEREGAGQDPYKIMLMRAVEDHLMDQAAYEYFAGRDVSGNARWSSDIDDRKPVFEDQGGARGPMVAYNASLNRYLMAVQHYPQSKGNIGIFDSPSPWGPWTTILYENGWGAGHISATSFYWNFSPKWWTNDGKDFVLVFTGRDDLDSWNTVEGSLSVNDSVVTSLRD
jgi:Domain of unknown function (DUF4185)